MKIELAHDILAKAIYEKASTEDKMRLRVERFIHEQYEYFQESKALLRKEDLEFIRPFVDQANLTKEEQLFIDKSERQETLRQLRALIWVASIAVVLFIAGIVVFNYYRIAKQQTKKAIQKEKIAKSLYWLSEGEKAIENQNPDVAFRLTHLSYQNNTQDYEEIDEHLFDIQQEQLKFSLAHRKWVNDITISPNNKYILTSSNDATAVLWDMKGAYVQEYRHEEEIINGFFSPNSQRVITASRDRYIKMWNTESGEEVLRVRCEAPIKYATISKNGIIYVNLINNKSQLYNQKGELINSFVTDKSILHAEFSFNGKHLLFYEQEANNITIFEVETAQTRLINFPSFLITAHFSPSQPLVMGVAVNGSTKLYDYTTNSSIKLPLDRKFDVIDAKFSPDGREILLTGIRGDAQLWHLPSQEKLAEFYEDENIVKSTFSPDGNLVAFSLEDGRVGFWGVNEERIGEIQKERESKILEFLPDGKRIITTSFDNLVKVWGVAENLIGTISGIGTIASDNIPLASDKIVVASNTNKAGIWNLSSEQATSFLLTDNIIDIVASNDMDTIITASADSTITIWDSLGTVKSITKVTGVINEFRMNTNQREWMVVLNNKEVVGYNFLGDELFKINTGQLIQDLQYVPNSKNIAVTYRDSVIVWDRQGNKIVAYTNNFLVKNIEFTAKGKEALMLTRSRDALLFDEKGKRIRNFPHSQFINSATMSPDNNLILTAGNDGKAKIWRKNGEIIKIIDHKFAVNMARFAPNNKRIVTCSSDDIARIWNVSGDLEFEFSHPNLKDAFFTPNGKRLITVGGNQVKIWGLITRDEILKYYNKSTRPLTADEEIKYKITTSDIIDSNYYFDYEEVSKRQ